MITSVEDIDEDHDLMISDQKLFDGPILPAEDSLCFTHTFQLTIKGAFKGGYSAEPYIKTLVML